MGLFGREAAAGPTVEELEDRDLPPRVQGVVRGAVSPLHGRHQALVGLVGEIHQRLYCRCEGTVTGTAAKPGDPGGQSRCFRRWGCTNEKSPSNEWSEGLSKGGRRHLLSHKVALAVPSALRSLTSEFGMGSGVSPALSSPTEVMFSRATGPEEQRNTLRIEIGSTQYRTDRALGEVSRTDD